MAHARYESECLVLEAGMQGEANAHYLLLTKEFGLLRGSAQGVRLSQGKMRYALQEYSLLNISLVRGKEFWRIVGAEHIEHLWGKEGLPPQGLTMLAKIFTVVKRLVVGEEAHTELYVAIAACIAHSKEVVVPEKAWSAIEILIVARILMHLGYFTVTDTYRDLFENNSFDQELLTKVETYKKLLLFDINKALTESQL